jgi:hypothetical protein
MDGLTGGDIARLQVSLTRWVDDNRGDLIAFTASVDGRDADEIAGAMLVGLLALEHDDPMHDPKDYMP